MKDMISGAAAASALALLAAFPAYSASDGSPRSVCAVVTATTGKPRFTRAKSKASGRLLVGDFLYKKDFVETGPGEMAALALLSGVELRVNAQTRFEVTEGGGGEAPASIQLGAGQVWTRLLHGKAGFEVRTGAAVAAVRGTEADAEFRDRLTVRVYEGQVEVANGFGSQTLTAGSMIEVANAQSAPQAPRSMTPADQLAWQEGVAPKDADALTERLRAEAESGKDLEFSVPGKDGKDRKVRFKLKKN